MSQSELRDLTYDAQPPSACGGAGHASGIGNTFRQVGAVFGVATATAVFTASGSYRSAAEFVEGMSPAFLTLGSAFGIFVVLLVRQPAHRPANRAGVTT